MILIQEGNTYNIPLKTYYVESVAELSNIPASAPAGTVAEVNAPGNFAIYMKMANGTWNEL